MDAGDDEPDLVVLTDTEIPDELLEPEDFDDGSGDIAEPDDTPDPPDL